MNSVEHWNMNDKMNVFHKDECDLPSYEECVLVGRELCHLCHQSYLLLLAYSAFPSGDSRSSFERDLK